MNTQIRNFRWIVFLLALGYWFYQFFTIESWNDFGWQFRFLTIWALSANVIVAGQMLRISYGKSHNEIPHFVSLAVVLNISVVVNYWRLYLADPANFYADGEIIDWWQEYYLHVLGPILMWIDAFFILGVFRRVKRVILYILAFGLLYPIWIEFLVAPMNDSPVGSVTQGLPYDFLNNMEVMERLIFYGMITVGNLVFMLLGWGISRLIKRRRETAKA